jgi:uracil-DNA glycosylase
MSNWTDTNMKTIPYHNSYQEFFEKQNLNPIQEFIEKTKKAYENTKKVYPTKDLVFNVFNLVPLDNIKVIIIGQDPYINENEAMGFAFSVPKSIPIPPSLKNIYTELENDPGIDFTSPKHGDLTEWTTQGVFLLNASLTVLEKKSNSHSKIWKDFTNNFITYISTKKNNIIFCLWGNFAKTKEKYISNPDKHLIIKTAHPSPLSIAHQGSTYEKRWFDNHQFSKINDYLTKNKKEPVDWNLT